ncbi:ATP-dependent zinc metalloprotease FtsH [Solirubrobacter phytolaccae]|uniref:ATP-dependent zinc metalloprotease FtsH n=1 Tax=Solirubrobacter phytolaccae TaxID=1404360 RepID=A0A9X3NJP4_9ACTN|nr:ATP-dependent zinc metalloprotease FtsH [Solirubrobacter phytolaccae]MDA0184766.1 ATP-dependent zinc metalloprotease FtsH [Solirubrobacter phytolaccae]
MGQVLGGLSRALLRDKFTLFLIVASVALTVVFFSLLGGTRPSSSGSEVPLSVTLVTSEQKGIVKATLLDQDARVVSETSDGRLLWSAYPHSDAQTTSLIRTLRENGAVVGVDQQDGKPVKAILVQFLIPILLLVCLFALFTRIGADGGAGGIASFSNFKGKGRKRGAKNPNRITFDNVAGAGEAVVELREIRDYLENPAKYLTVGAAPPKGVLLVGPPGTGKTLLARATAGEADAAFFSVSGAEFVESLVGVGAARVRDLFAKARKMAPAIIFIDEVDAAGRKRGAGIGQGNDEREQTLNQLLVEMDGFGGDAGIVVMAATNRPDILDPALLRPGRFDRQVVVDVPDVHGRFEILQLHGKKKPIDPEADLMEVSKLCPGFSGAELANVVNEAALLAVRQGQELIDQATLEEAIDRVVAGPAKKHVISLRERQVVAIHEASHAVVAQAIGQTTGAGVQKLSIVARGRTLGTSASQLVDKDVTVQQQPDLERQLCAILAGAAGEKVQFGFVSTAVNDDLHAATNLARSMVTSFGMSEELGMVTIGEQGGEVFLGASLQELGSVGPATLELIDNEVERIVGEAVDRATVLLRANWDTVREIAQVLLDHETVSGVALEALLTPVMLERDVPPQANGRRPKLTPPVE